MLPNILWIGDAGVQTGFAKATHEILDRLCQDFHVSVLAINYRGDPPKWDYDLYATLEDRFGTDRLIELCDRTRPQAIVIQNDGWNIPGYIRQLRRFKEYKELPVVAVVAVDGKNFQGSWLDGVAHAIFWTSFALHEARLGGYSGPASVIPLGVDLDVFYPMDKEDARFRIFGKYLPDDIFVVGSVNRNQPRKRWDLLVKYFGEWVCDRKLTDAFLHLHVAPTGDVGIDVDQLTEYYGVKRYVTRREPSVWYGISEDEMRITYNCFDVFASTTQGEGFGLTTFEAMACGIPGIMPNWSALGELCENAALLIPCTTTAIGPPYVNVIGGIPDQESFTENLNALYENREYLASYRTLGLARVQEPRFRWNNIAAEYAEVLDSILPQRAPALDLVEEVRG